VVNKYLKQLSIGLGVLVFCLAIISSVLLISGDQLGRVNLLFLMVLFVVFPVISIITTLIFPLIKRPGSFVTLLLAVPIWPRQWLDAISQLKRDCLFNAWLFKESQKLVLIFSSGCILAFVFVLLFNDVSFVWRSTLLNAQQVYPLLKMVAYPWFFFEGAQPALAMVSVAQDSRLAVSTEISATSVWWRYVFMAQLCYAFVPRLALFVWASATLNKAIGEFEKNQSTASVVEVEQKNVQPLAPITDNGEAISNYVLLSWNTPPEVVLEKLHERLGVPSLYYDLSTSLTAELEQQLVKDTRDKLLVVAAWEPPMGELQDFMESTAGVLMPIDWHTLDISLVSSVHLDEWRRFCYPLSNWRLQQLID
jgi:hypothetical protein